MGAGEMTQSTHCAGCGACVNDHIQTIVDIAFSPFNTPKVKYVLLCPTSTFKSLKPKVEDEPADTPGGPVSKRGRRSKA